MARIAVVEDNPDNRLLLQALLEERHQLTEYENGPDALEGMRAAPPELVLLDISLPRMDGTEVLRRMRGDPVLAALPVIALTAHAMAEDRDKALAAGCDHFDTKPVDITRLLAKIEGLLPGIRT